MHICDSKNKNVKQHFKKLPKTLMKIVPRKMTGKGKQIKNYTNEIQT